MQYISLGKLSKLIGPLIQSDQVLKTFLLTQKAMQHYNRLKESLFLEAKRRFGQHVLREISQLIGDGSCIPVSVTVDRENGSTLHEISSGDFKVAIIPVSS